jgi:hypothetical protein
MIPDTASFLIAETFSAGEDSCILKEWRQIEGHGMTPCEPLAHFAIDITSMACMLYDEPHD